jgi:hypothetical protein
MKKALEAVALVALLAAAPAAWATPSTTFWTPATTYTQPFAVPHLTYDTYFGEQGALQIDTGLTVGVLPFEKVQAEIGFDLFYPGLTQDFFQLNGRLTLVEGAVAPWSPSLSVGIANAGFEEDVSDYHLLHATLGKATPFGLLGVGGYYGAGSDVLWTSSEGDENRAGFMASWVSPDVVPDLPGLQKVNVLADVATGENWLGGFGGGVALYFTPAVALLTGPVFFLDQDFYQGAIGTDWLWTFQIDVDVDLMRKPKS